MQKRLLLTLALLVLGGTCSAHAYNDNELKAMRHGRCVRDCESSCNTPGGTKMDWQCRHDCEQSC